MASGFRGDNALKNFGMPTINYVPRPRAPPRLIRPPMPLHMERPQPIVPDVSLIIDSAATSFHSNPERSLNEDQLDARNNSNSAQNHFAFPRHIPNRSEDTSQATPNILNFANYYPTPPENLRSNDNSHNTSKEDSGNGSSSLVTAAADLSHSRTSRNDSTASSSSASENLPLDSLGNTSNKSERSHPLLTSTDSGYNSLKADIASVMKIVNSQADTIQKLSSQLQKIVAFQDKFLVHFVRKGSTVSKYVQTELLEEEADSPEFRQMAVLQQENVREVDKKGRSSGGKRSVVNCETTSPPLSVPPPHQNNSKKASPSMRQELLKNKIGINSAPPPPSEESKKIGGGGEDLSQILKNLQISNVQHPSTYSDTSMRSIECPPFHDDTFQHETSSYIGPSASAQGSDLDEEEIFPSVTYYNNLLSTVNRILDGGQKPGGGGAPPTTANKTTPPPPSSSSSSSSASSKRQSVKNMMTSKKSPSPPEQSYHGTVSYSSGASGSSVDSLGDGYNNGRNNECKENFPPRGTSPNMMVNKYLDQRTPPNNNVDRSDNSSVESTKKYLRSLGIQFDSPSSPTSQQQQSAPPPLSQKQNYMIQQNVYNSIYIPTVNCVPVISESLNSNSGLIDNLARKYITSGERNQYEMMAGKSNEPGAHAETTVYGMTPGNLSFATKEYLKRHGLVDQSPAISSHPHRQQQQRLNYNELPHTSANAAAAHDKVLDITAIRNQPKLL